MLKELSSVQAYLPFIHAMLADPDFCDPMLATPAQLHQHLLDAHEDPAKHLFGTFDGGTLTGLFSVLVLPALFASINFINTGIGFPLVFMYLKRSA